VKNRECTIDRLVLSTLNRITWHLVMLEWERNNSTTGIELNWMVREHESKLDCTRAWIETWL